MKTIKSTLLVAFLILVFIGAIIIVQNKNLFTDGSKQEKKKEQDPHGKQLAYLKKHEEEIKEFVKSQNSKIESVQIDWNETIWEEVGNGTPQGGGEVVSIFGEFNNLKDSDWNVLIEIKDGKVDLESMGISNGIRLGGGMFE
ncbi:hypothetical protein K1J08_00720 [Streptococcus sanguinis]|uniref:hypothetical protein n=1 Tax=Streptococcus sanguinis TaxID=1305 RepID=UPI001CBFD39E|nr:hypothetical protein [Streptococcus sanguinis]MBZ2037255.1 hypothetical protein [Streptococcus sanguinis]MBZ2069802.1 hypothetical protein [Streptococcus sanguinis]